MTEILTEQQIAKLVMDGPKGMFLLTYRGSIAHGMYQPDESGGIDDIDLIGFVFAPAEHYIGLEEWHSRGTWEQKKPPFDLLWYEARKAVSLLLQGNPNILSALWCEPECYKYQSQPGKELLENRFWFLSKRLYKPFAGYAAGQMQRMDSYDRKELERYLDLTSEMKRRGIHPNQPVAQQDRAPGCGPGDSGSSSEFGAKSDEQLRLQMKAFHKKNSNIGYLGEKRKRLILDRGYDTKNAAHLIRLLKMCTEVLKDGVMLVDRRRAGDAEELMSIKRGDWRLVAVKEYAESLFAAAKKARELSSLPEEPDWANAEKWLVRALRCELSLTNGNGQELREVLTAWANAARDHGVADLDDVQRDLLQVAERWLGE